MKGEQDLWGNYSLQQDIPFGLNEREQTTSCLDASVKDDAAPVDFSRRHIASDELHAADLLPIRRERTKTMPTEDVSHITVSAKRLGAKALRAVTRGLDKLFDTEIRSAEK